VEVAALRPRHGGGQLSRRNAHRFSAKEQKNAQIRHNYLDLLKNPSFWSISGNAIATHPDMPI